ncbi:MAG: ribosome biogenesis GTPase Der [Gammaproteobacteria bacterium]
MKPVIALVGRPNVGKSTLFNKLTKSRDALVADMPGLTRDRKFGEGQVGDKAYIVVDTGGLSGELTGIDAVMADQSWQAAEQADMILFLVDAHAGLSALDQDIAKRLRTQVGTKPITLVLNKIDGRDVDMVQGEFFALGFGNPQPISAAQGRGINPLMQVVLADLPEVEAEEDEAEKGIRIAVVGRPNVGKSTLVNRMLGEERVVTFDMPGTTRDSIYLPFERDDQRYTLIDTAGVRRRGKVSEAVEKFSVIKALQAIEDANVVLMVMDAREGITDQDASLIGFVMDAGRGLILIVNKWDGLNGDQKDKVKRDLEIKLPFVDFAPLHYTSALHGTGVGELFATIKKVYRSCMSKFATPRLTRLLEDMLATHPPPMVHGRRIKLRYMHQGGKNPPLFIIHGNQTERVPNVYQRYLVNKIRTQLKLFGTPIRVEFKTTENPFKDRRNTLTPRQKEKRRRLMKHVKGK